MNFLQDHIAAVPGHLAYHARTLLNPRHRSLSLGICTGDGKATAILLNGRRVVAFADDFTALLDPPIRLDTIRGEWDQRIKSVAADDRAGSVDGFRRKFLELNGASAIVRGACVLDRPRGTAVAEVWAGRRGEDIRMSPATILDQVRRNPKDKIESWTGDNKDPWHWHLLLPNLGVPGEETASSNYLAFGALEPDVLEMERWAEETGRVELDLLITGQYAALRFLSEGFFEPSVPCIVSRVYPVSGQQAAPGAAPDNRAMLCAWDGEKVTHISTNQDLPGLPNRVSRLAASLIKESSLRATTTKGGGTGDPLGPVPFYVLAPPGVTLPVATDHTYQVVMLQKSVLCDPNGIYRRRCPDVAGVMEGDLPGTPELFLALWAAIRIPGFAEAKAEDPSAQYLSESYRARQLRRTTPIMRKGAGATLALIAFLVLLLPVAAYIYWDGDNAAGERDAAAAASHAKQMELSTFGETTLRLEDLKGWSVQAERWPLSAFLAKMTSQLPDSIALREVRVRTLPEGAANPTGYELIFSGFSKADAPSIATVLTEAFPGASIREIPPANMAAGGQAGDGAIIPPADPNLTPWRMNVTVDFARLDAGKYSLTAPAP